MKLAIISDEVAQDFDRVIAFAKDFQLDGIEIRSVWDKPPHKLTEEDAERIGATMRDAGLQVCGVASPVLKCNLLDADEVAAHIAILDRCLTLAHLWQSPLIRVFTGWRAADPTSQFDLAARIFRDELLPRAAARGVVLGVENEYSTNVCDSDEILGFYQTLNAPGTTLVWDPCNILYMEQQTDSLGHDLPRVAALIGHFHVKDARRVAGGPQPAEGVCIGDGEVQIHEHLDALRARGYDGWVSLETHWRQTKVLSEEEANLPMGQAFSQAAEPASRECMSRLAQWVRGGGGK